MGSTGSRAATTHQLTLAVTPLLQPTASPPLRPPVMTWKKGIKHATKVMSATKVVRQMRRRVRPVSQRGQRGQSCSCSSTRHKKGMLGAGRIGKSRRDREH